MTHARFSRLFLFVAAASPICAQTSATLSGAVTDSSGAVVSAAEVTIKNVDTGAVRNTPTDAAGRYQAPSLPVGQYEIHAAKTGFSEQIRAGINLVVGQSATVDLTLSVGQSSQQVTVNADAPLVSVTTSDISGLVGGQQIRDLPLNGRSYDELLTLNPGVVNFTWEKFGGVGVSNSTSGNNFAVSGNRPQQNLFLLNGIEFTGAAENNMQPGGTSQQLLGVDAVAEFNLFRDSYGAEYGKRPGAQVVIVTRGGGNEVHGSVYEFLRNNAMDARNFFDPGSAPGFERNQYGVALGGPVKKDKTFLFGNFEGFNQHLHQTGCGSCTGQQRAQRSLALRAGHARAEQLLLRLVIGGRIAADQCLAHAHSRRSRFWRNLGGVQQSASDHSRRFRNHAHGSHRLEKGLAECDLHHRRQRGFYAHQL